LVNDFTLGLINNNSKKVYNYTVILEKEAEGDYHAFCPLLKGCHSQGTFFKLLGK
jgi:hypothetical protein